MALIKPLNWGELWGGGRGWEGHLSGADQTINWGELRGGGRGI